MQSSPQKGQNLLLNILRAHDAAALTWLGFVPQHWDAAQATPVLALLLVKTDPFSSTLVTASTPTAPPFTA